MTGLDWRAVWERKGLALSDDLKELDGFEQTTIDPQFVVSQIGNQLQLHKDDLLLEVGCGAGMLAQYFSCNYIGMDYSSSLLRKFRRIIAKPCLQAEALNIPLSDKSVDIAIAYSVFHYFPNQRYASRAIFELMRVSRRAIFIGDLPTKSISTDHLLFEKIEFEGWAITDGFYNPLRFNATLGSFDKHC